MTKLDRLKKQAKASAENRGHALGRFKDVKCERPRSHATCYRCGMEVYVMTDPSPNEIEVSGEAVAMDCTGAISEEKRLLCGLRQ